MAYKKETYSSPGHLVQALHDYLTTLADGDRWSVVWGTAPTNSNTQDTQCVYRARGSSGTENIYVGVQVQFNEAMAQYYLMFLGLQGLNSEATTVKDHFNVSAGVVMSFGGSAFQYETRFFANARRFMIHTQFGAYSQFAYCGLMIPIARPAEYPYPLMVCANMAEAGTISGSTKYNYTSNDETRNSDGWAAGSTNFRILQPDNTWASGRGFDSKSSPDIGVYPWTVGRGDNGNKAYKFVLSTPVSAFRGASSDSTMLRDYYKNFVDSGLGPLLEQNYIRKRTDGYTDSVLGSMEGVRGVIGSKVAGSEITDNANVKHYVVSCFNQTVLVAALEMQ